MTNDCTLGCGLVYELDSVQFNKSNPANQELIYRKWIICGTRLAATQNAS